MIDWLADPTLRVVRLLLRSNRNTVTVLCEIQWPKRRYWLVRFISGWTTSNFGVGGSPKNSIPEATQIPAEPGRGTRCARHSNGSATKPGELPPRRSCPDVSIPNLSPPNLEHFVYNLQMGLQLCVLRSILMGGLLALSAVAQSGVVYVTTNPAGAACSTTPAPTVEVYIGVSPPNIYACSGATGTWDLTAVPLTAAPLSVTVAGAPCNGTADDTTYFTTAFSVSKSIYVPAGLTCVLDNLGSWPDGAILQLWRGGYAQVAGK